MDNIRDCGLCQWVAIKGCQDHECIINLNLSSAVCAQQTNAEAGIRVLVLTLLIKEASSKLIRCMLLFFLGSSELKQLKIALKFIPVRSDAEADETEKGNAVLAGSGLQ